MALSEDEVNEMAKSIDTIDIDAETEMAWTRNELAQVRAMEKSHVLAFRVHKRLRRDEQMQQAQKVILDLRQMIKYFEERLAALHDPDW